MPTAMPPTAEEAPRPEGHAEETAEADGGSLKADDPNKKVTALFDNEAIWDTDETDAFILASLEQFAASGLEVLTLKDQVGCLCGFPRHALSHTPCAHWTKGWNSFVHMAALWNRPHILDELVRKGAELNDKNKV